MRFSTGKRGFSLVELLTVIAVILILVGIGIPAAKALIASFETGTGAASLIDAALASARAVAAAENKYAGIRFQQDASGSLYMITIINDPSATGFVNGFRAVDGRAPMKLPAGLGVADFARPDTGTGAIGIDEPKKVIDATTFSIIFSPSGRLVTHDVRVSSSSSDDRVFNTPVKVNNKVGMFIQDDNYHDDNQYLAEEPGRTNFVIFDRKLFDKSDSDSRYSYCLKYAQPVFINPSSGRIINMVK